jgi:hypothetical protein
MRYSIRHHNHAADPKKEIAWEWAVEEFIYKAMSALTMME